MRNRTVCNRRRRKFRSFTRSSRSIRGRTSTGARVGKTPGISDTTRDGWITSPTSSGSPRPRSGIPSAWDRSRSAKPSSTSAAAPAPISASSPRSSVFAAAQSRSISHRPWSIGQRRNARLLGLRNAEVHVADIAAVPLGDACADVVISNGAINLSPHKPCVFQEVFRILRPGGRFQFADMVRDCAAATPNCGSSADCISGTVEPQRYLDMLGAAGFGDAELEGPAHRAARRLFSPAPALPSRNGRPRTFGWLCLL